MVPVVRPATPRAPAKAGIRERAYAQAALDGCAEELADTAAGDRNNILYKKSFRIGTMVARGWIARTEVEAALFDAAAACGLVADDGERADAAHDLVRIRRWRQTAPHPDLPDQDALQITAQERSNNRKHRRAAALADAHAVFKKWLGDEYDLDAASAAIAAAASERLPGDPLWLLIVAGPGGAKTETVQALAGCRRACHQHHCERRRAAVRDTAPGAQQEGHRRTAAQDRRPRRACYQRRHQHPERRPQHARQRARRYSRNLRRQMGAQCRHRWRRHPDLGRAASSLSAP